MLCGKDKSRRRITALLLILVAAEISCCRRELPQKEPLDFVPPSADVIAILDYSTFVRNKILRSVLDVSQLERALARIGIPSDTILNIAGFVHINPSAIVSPSEERPGEAIGEFGLIVQGKGGFKEFFKALSEAGWIRRESEGKTLWVSQTEDLVVVSLENNTLAAGTSEAVRQVVDVALGKSPPAVRPDSGNRSGEIIRRMGVRGEVNVAIGFSQEMKVAAEEVSRSAGMFRGMTGANMLGGLFQLLGAGHGVGLSFEGRDEGIASRVVFVARDAPSAKLIASMVAVAKILVPRLGDFGGTEVAELARGVNVSSQNNFVLIDFRISEQTIHMFLGRARGDSEPSLSGQEEAP